MAMNWQFKKKKKGNKEMTETGAVPCMMGASSHCGSINPNHLPGATEQCASRYKRCPHQGSTGEAHLKETASRMFTTALFKEKEIHITRREKHPRPYKNEDRCSQ